MIDLEWIIAQLDTLKHFNDIGRAVDAAAAIGEFVARPPACYVSTTSERASPNELASGAFRQRVTQTISILFVLGAERRSDSETDAVELTRTLVRNLLLGVTPPGADGPFQFASYSLRAMDQGLIWGELLFAAPYYLTKR